VANKTLLQQNPPVLNRGCRLTQVTLYNGYKMVVVVYLKHGGPEILEVCVFSTSFSSAGFLNKVVSGFLWSLEKGFTSLSEVTEWLMMEQRTQQWIMWIWWPSCIELIADIVTELALAKILSDREDTWHCKLILLDMCAAYNAFVITGQCTLVQLLKIDR